MIRIPNPSARGSFPRPKNPPLSPQSFLASSRLIPKATLKEVDDVRSVSTTYFDEDNRKETMRLNGRTYVLCIPITYLGSQLEQL